MPVSRVVLADDYPEILKIAAQVLDHDFLLLKTCPDGHSLLEQEPSLHPDIVILDVSLGDMNGFDVAKELRRNGSTAKVVFLSIHEEEDFIKAGMQAGASGYVIKRRLYSDLVPALHAAEAGEVFISSRM